MAFESNREERNFNVSLKGEEKFMFLEVASWKFYFIWKFLGYEIIFCDLDCERKTSRRHFNFNKLRWDKSGKNLTSIIFQLKIPFYFNLVHYPNRSSSKVNRLENSLATNEGWSSAFIALQNYSEKWSIVGFDLKKSDNGQTIQKRF